MIRLLAVTTPCWRYRWNRAGQSGCIKVIFHSNRVSIMSALLESVECPAFLSGEFYKMFLAERLPLPFAEMALVLRENFPPTRLEEIWMLEKHVSLEHLRCSRSNYIYFARIMAPERSTEAPQQHKQPSRKGKRAWRKHVDVSDVQAGLEEVREEVIKGSVLCRCILMQSHCHLLLTRIQRHPRRQALRRTLRL